MCIFVCIIIFFVVVVVPVWKYLACNGLDLHLLEQFKAISSP